MTTVHRLFAAALTAIAPACAASALAQGAPFTIRRPPDGSTVREQVRVEIPAASVRTGDTIAFYVDGKFVVALPPADPSSPDYSRGAPFTYMWDTKGNDVPGQELADGDHTIKAVLYEPVSGTEAMGVTAQSEVKVTVQNKISGNVGPMYLRYKYREGANIVYSRVGRSFIVGALSGLSDVGDRQMASVDSRLQLAIEDVRPDSSLVRNKLTSLILESNGQESKVDPQDLSASMYQELDPEGHVLYETATGPSLEEFTETGLAVNNTLELPLLPAAKVAVGDSWSTPFQRIDIPGMPSALQPRVDLNNKFDGLEWESGYPTAKIRQTFEGTVDHAIKFGQIEVTSPRITFDRVIYLAYKSGTLVKVVRTLTVSGSTTAVLEKPVTGAGTAGAGAGSMRGAAGGPRMGAGAGLMGGAGGRRMGGGLMGGGALMGGMGRAGGGSMAGGGAVGAGAGSAGAGRLGGGSVTVGETSHPVVLKSMTITQLVPRPATSHTIQ